MLRRNKIVLVSLIIFNQLCIIYPEIEWLRNQKGDNQNELFT